MFRDQWKLIVKQLSGSDWMTSGALWISSYKWFYEDLTLEVFREPREMLTTSLDSINWVFWAPETSTPHQCPCIQWKSVCRLIDSSFNALCWTKDLCFRQQVLAEPATNWSLQGKGRTHLSNFFCLKFTVNVWLIRVVQRFWQLEYIAYLSQIALNFRISV